MDCGFTAGNQWFRYRAAAIIVENGCVLLAGNEEEDYLYSVGGGVHHGETSEDAVRREVLEETGAAYEIDHLAVIHENFWEGKGAFDKGLDCHEIAFYYWMKPRGSQELCGDSVTRFHVRETMHWISIEDLDKHKYYPSFLKDYLSEPHPEVRHLVTRERSEYRS